jgi:hypothetical protein
MKWSWLGIYYRICLGRVAQIKKNVMLAAEIIIRYFQVESI